MTQTPSPAPRTFGWKKTLLFSAIPVVVLLGGLEVAARVAEVWMPPRPVDLGQGFSPESRLFVASPSNPEMLVTNPERIVSFRDQTFPKRKPPRTLRIFALGGSSVNYVDYEFPALESRLQEALAADYDHVEIINCGGLSYGSHRLVLIAAEVMGYEPDLIMIYSGHNEFEEIEQLDLANLHLVSLQRVLSRAAVYRFIRDRIASFQIARLESEHNRRLMANNIPDTSRTWNHEFTRAEQDLRMAAYHANLETIIRMCRDNRVGCVIGTVPSNLVKPNLPGEAGLRYHAVLDLFARQDYEGGLRLARKILREVPRHQASDAENEIIRSLAKQYQIPLADVESAVVAAEPHHVPGETLFTDHCHLDAEGNAILAATYEKAIRQSLLDTPNT